MENFLDQAKIFLQAGAGGDGAVSFRREKYVPRGGPDGGNGGRGGSIYLVIDPRRNTLAFFRRRRHFRAQPGGHGKGKKQQGKNGRDLLIPVPPGTLVRDASTQELLVDLTPPQEQVLAAQGGLGGRGNTSFASSINQAPRLREKGERGESRWLLLELKLIADVGIMGLPNAGKSTLLAHSTAAQPKIAPYPFTTLYPNLGVVELEDQSFVLIDIPGLIEGAHTGKGLGHDFLRHIERTRLLIHLLDGAADSPLSDYDTLRRELQLFNPALVAKPHIVALNKIDLPAAQENWPRVEQELAKRGVEARPISALTGQGVMELIYRVATLLAQIPRPTKITERVVLRPSQDGSFTIQREGQGYRILGRNVEKAVARTDWQLPEAVARLRRTLEATGVTQDLLEAGVKPGDTVFVGDQELVWWGEEEPLPR